MKNLICLFLVCSTVPALADHSLADAMSENPTLEKAVALTMQANDVVCDTASSNQSRAIEGSDDAWKQIALCFKTESDLAKAQQQLKHGNDLGFYGLSGVVGVLVAKYTWVDFKPGALISVVYQ